MTQADNVQGSPAIRAAGRRTVRIETSHPGLRPCEPHDLQDVARLFARKFRRSRKNAIPQIEAHFREILFNHPWRDRDLPSYVSFADDGRLDGFIGVLPMRMEFDGRPVRAAIGCSLMVENPQKNPLLGARLLRMFLNGPQELSLSDTSGSITVPMWERLGGSVATAYSFEWVRLLRTAEGACALLGRTAHIGLLPLAKAIDYALIASGKSQPIKPVKALVRQADPEAPAFQTCFLQLADQFRLRLKGAGDDIAWLLRQGRRKSQYGSLICKLVHEAGKAPVGCFVYHARPKGVVSVLQILSIPGKTELVLDALFKDALESGHVAVRGRTQPELIGPLQLRHCYFRSKSSWLTFKTKDPDVLAAIRSGDALLTGLSGESWTQLVGGLA